MADNYLEKKMEEFRSAPQKGVVKRPKTQIKQLLQKNRGYLVFDAKVVVRESHLNDIIQVNEILNFLDEGENFEFRGVVGEQISKISPYIDMDDVPGAVAQQEPDWDSMRAFIVVCAESIQEVTYVDLGISIMAMSLRATEMGLNATPLMVSDSEGMAKELGLAYSPIMVLAIGKGIELPVESKKG